MAKKSSKQYLTTDELHMLALGDAQGQLRKAQDALERKQLEVLKLQQELATERYFAAKQRRDADQAAHRTKLAELRNKYNIGESDRWGHDPISGELIIDRSES